MDVWIVAVVSGLALGLHVALFVLIRRWMDRDLALSFAGEDVAKRDYMLESLARARRERVRRRELAAWLESAERDYRDNIAARPGGAPR